MRCYKIVTWILILSIVNFNFVLGAPAAVRERLETEGEIATSQKRAKPPKRYRGYPFDEGSTTNAADLDRLPTPNLSGLDELWGHLGEEDINWPESPGSPESSVDSNQPNHEPSNPGSESPESRPPGLPVGPPLPHSGPSAVRFPSPPGGSEPESLLSPTGHQPTPLQSQTGDSLLPLQSPTSGSPVPHNPGPSEDRFPNPPGKADGFLDELMKGKIKRRNFSSGTVAGTQGHQSIQT